MKRRIAFGVAGIVLVAAVWLLVAERSASDGPVYQGKTARQWLGEFYTSNQMQAFAALRQMGTNAVPFLVDEVKRNDSAWDKFYTRNYPRLPQSIQKHVPQPVERSKGWNAAGSMLAYLHAETAIPDLLDLLADKSDDRRRLVLAVLTEFVRPTSTNWIPGIINCLQSTDDDVCKEALNLLHRIGPDARATPAVTNLMNSPDKGIRFAALNYLRQIDPKLAEKYEISDQEQPSATNSQPELRGKQDGGGRE